MSEENDIFQFVGGVDTHLTPTELGKAVFYSCPICGAVVAYTDSGQNGMKLHADWHRANAGWTGHEDDAQISEAAAVEEPTP